MADASGAVLPAALTASAVASMEKDQVVAAAQVGTVFDCKATTLLFLQKLAGVQVSK